MNNKEIEPNLNIMLAKNMKRHSKSQFSLKPDPKPKDIEKQGHHFSLEKIQPAKFEWDRIVFI